MKPALDVPLVMKGTPCSRGNYAPLKTSSKTGISVLRSRGSAPGGVWGSAPTLLASSVNGSDAGYAPHTTPIPRSGFVRGRRADIDAARSLHPVSSLLLRHWRNQIRVQIELPITAQAAVP